MSQLKELEERFQAEANYMTDWQERWHKQVIEHVKETIRGFVRVSEARVKGDAALIKRVLVEELRNDWRTTLSEEVEAGRGQFRKLGYEKAIGELEAIEEYKAEHPSLWRRFLIVWDRIWWTYRD
jgi:hypothetical protein